MKDLAVEASISPSLQLRYRVLRTKFGWQCDRVIDEDGQSVLTRIIVEDPGEILLFISADSIARTRPAFLESLRAAVREMA